MAFIKFTEHGRSYTARASISKTGMLSLSHGARKRFNLDDYRCCVLYYDPETRRIGIELTNDKDAEGARNIRLRLTGADVAIKSFVDFFDLAVEQTTLYPVERDDETGFLVIDMKKGKIRAEKKLKGRQTGT